MNELYKTLTALLLMSLLIGLLWGWWCTMKGFPFIIGFAIGTIGMCLWFIFIYIIFSLLN